MSAAIEDKPRDNKFDLPTIGRYLYLVGGLLVTINGLIFIGEEFNGLNRCSGSNCIGPALVWNTGSFISTGQNAAWRRVFPLDPILLFRNWTGVALGTIMMIVHLPGFKLSFCTRTWLHVCFFTIFTMLFGAFPYAGNLGIIIGFSLMPLVFLSFLMAFLPATRHEPTTLLLKPVWRVNMSCLVDNPLFLNITRWLSLFVSLFVIAVGLVHVFGSNFRWCPTGVWSECAGPSLRWNSANQDFLADANNESGWRSVFTFQIDIFCALWGPIIVGYISTIQHVRGHLWTSIYQSWPRVFLWFMFLGLFGSMGYTGNLGILCGFSCIVVALFALLITIGGAGNAQTNLEINLPAVVDRNRT